MIKWFRKKDRAVREGQHFPAGFTDIHSHILPGLDDGASSPEVSLILLDHMVGLGIRRFVFTPHVMDGVWNNSSTAIRHALENFRNRVEEKYGQSIYMDVGAEYMIDGGLDKLIQTDDLLPVRDNLVLVEMSFVAPPIHLYKSIADLQIGGYRPLLAHPERYFFYHNDPDNYLRLKEAGCLFQLNLLSLSNYYGKDVRKTAEWLLSQNLYDLVGSDLHHERHFSQLKKIAQSRSFGKKVWSLLERNCDL